MSYHVYLARRGFKETPIPPEAWFAAARACPELTVDERPNRHGRLVRRVWLGKEQRAWLSLNPHGVVEAQDPSPELIAVMLKLAGPLDAAVYSEKLKQYESVEDWEKRTEPYRQLRDGRRATARKKRLLRRATFVAVVLAGALLGYFRK